ncbi:MAG TPA: Rv2578c family radical SAM protein [Mycobacteriales bacterium]|nr:Rv2578c family radical SAM protein [Mycobacteriales bacterium]
MRWDGLRVGNEPMALFGEDVVTRQFDTPGFRGITFYEVRARSILNEVPKSSRMAFRWTVNPYRGCSHACVYCFARNTHTYLDLDAGADFDSRIIVKINAAERLRQQLRAPSWKGESVAMGTNVDPYQRAEGRYRLMPGILSALIDARNPFSILTKGSLVLRDLPLLERADAVTTISVNVSVGSVDPLLWRLAEPGTPNPRRRLDVVRTLADSGISCGVLMAPILPFLTDSTEQLEETVAAIAGAGARSITPLVLHLRPGAREWYAKWIKERYPQLVSDYRELYGRGSYAPAEFQREITDRVWALAERYGLRKFGSDRLRPAPSREPRPAEQLSLM